MHRLTRDRLRWGLLALTAGAVLGGIRLFIAQRTDLLAVDVYRVLETMFNSPLTLVIPPTAFVGCLLGARRTELGPRIGAALLFGAAAALVFWFGWMGWWLRDGLKAGMEVSAGSEAVDRFLPDLLPVIHLAEVLCGVGMVLCWRFPKRRTWTAQAVRLVGPAARCVSHRGVTKVRVRTKRRARRPSARRLARRLMAWSQSAALAGALLISLELLPRQVWPYWAAKHHGSDAILPCALLAHVDLHGAILSNADLTSSNLTGADLRHAHLAGAKLREACLTDADLDGAHLSAADLIGANLVRTRLSGAHLEGARLMGSQFRSARLAGTSFSRSDLRLADFSNADLMNADLSLTNLRGVELTTANLAAVNLTDASYDRHTGWPIGFDPKRHGAVWMECAKWRNGGSDP